MGNRHGRDFESLVCDSRSGLTFKLCESTKTGLPKDRLILHHADNKSLNSFLIFHFPILVRDARRDAMEKSNNKKNEWIRKRKSTTTRFQLTKRFHLFLLNVLLLLLIFELKCDWSSRTCLCLYARNNTCNRRRVYLLSVLNCLTTNSNIMQWIWIINSSSRWIFFFCVCVCVFMWMLYSIHLWMQPIGTSSISMFQYKTTRRKRKRIIIENKDVLFHYRNQETKNDKRESRIKNWTKTNEW